ncbi:MAG: type II secretion system F family protein, partial [Nanoarchaeota archaeon]|nr:type II secretion system F family protein [Nanoarchaeota archaeon]
MATALKWESRHIIAIIIGVLMIVFDVALFINTPWFIPLIVLAITMAWSQHWIDFFVKARLDRELEEKFPEFVRNLVSAVKSGMPMTRALVQVSNTDYGGLNPYVQKLANQVEWAIPVHKALLN